MLDGFMEDHDEEGEPAQIVLSASNFGTFPMGNGISRLASRFWGDDDVLAKLRQETDRASTPPKRWSWAWSPTPRTTSTGRTRCGSCWRSGPRCRPTRSPAWRPTTASSARDHGDAHLRPSHGVAELDLRAAERVGEDGALRRYGTGRKADFDRKRV
jgi:benzoyl-CoA-dihydrodiol lyase